MASSSSSYPPPQPIAAAAADVANRASQPDAAKVGGVSAALGSMNMDELLRDFCSDLSPQAAAGAREGSGAEEVWDEIIGGGGGGGRRDGGCSGGSEITLEDFLAREGAGREERAGVGSAASGAMQLLEGTVLGFGSNGAETSTARGRKRPTVDPADRAAMQRQKRMIKNRESAARSRERKQAYIAELEQMVSQLEEENEELLREEEERNKMRLKQLMQNTAPANLRRPARLLRRTGSMEW